MATSSYSANSSGRAISSAERICKPQSSQAARIAKTAKTPGHRSSAAYRPATPSHPTAARASGTRSESSLRHSNVMTTVLAASNSWLSNARLRGARGGLPNPVTMYRSACSILTRAAMNLDRFRIPGTTASHYPAFPASRTTARRLHSVGECPCPTRLAISERSRTIPPRTSPQPR